MIRGKNIILRTIRKSDMEELFRLNSDFASKGEFSTVHMPSEVFLNKRFDENGMWSDDFGKMLIITKDEEQRILGEVTYFRGLHYAEGYEIGYQLFRPEDRGKGYMSEALLLFSAYLFALKPIPRLEVNTDEGNIASRKTAEKCGYKYDGTMRKAVFNRGVYMDLALYSLLREECPDISELIEK